MLNKLKIASILLYIVSIATICMGLLYCLTPTLMPYHEKFLQRSFFQLDHQVAVLMMSLLRVAGYSFLSLGITLFLLVKLKFSRGDREAWQIIMIMSLVALLPLLWITLSIGLYTPWWLVSLLLILDIIALLISKNINKKRIK